MVCTYLRGEMYLRQLKGHYSVRYDSGKEERSLGAAIHLITKPGTGAPDIQVEDTCSDSLATTWSSARCSR